MQSPVLFLIFNRPEPTRRVFEALRAARPPRLYIAADGPRSSRPGEAARCAATREVITTIDWPCEVRTLLRDDNLGCKRAVSGGIDWFFEQEEQGIIIEDDVLPDPTFFPYCDELLDRYRDVEQVGMISGDNFQFGTVRGEASYYFSRYAHIWGWASWRRTWRRYDRDMKAWPEFKRTGGLQRVLGRRRDEVGFWTRTFDATHAGKIDTWDHQLSFSMWAHGMLSLLPQSNLVANIGFGADATHTSGASRYADMPRQRMEFPLAHPASISQCTAADDFTASQMFVRPLHMRVIERLRTMGRRFSTG
jgi:hypothetical protein